MSVFFAVLLSIILVFENTFYALTGYRGAQMLLPRLLEQSAYSVMADFDGHVKEQYGLYMLYQDGVPLKDKLVDSVIENLGYEAESGMFPMHLQNLKVSATGFSHLSALETQILSDCKYRVPIATIEEFLTRAGDFLDFLQVETPELFPSIGDPTESYDPEAEYDEEAYGQYDMRGQATDLLKNTLSEQSGNVKISDSVFHSLPSHRLITGSGPDLLPLIESFAGMDWEEEAALDIAMGCVDDLSAEGGWSTLYEDFLINEYIVSVFNSKVYQNRTENGYLKGEVEYLIFGSQSDDANINYMKALILLLRFVLNTIYIYGQQDMVTVAEIASYLATLPFFFEGQPVVKQGILLAWSFMESWNDYTLLEKGKPVPIYKTKETWKYWTSYKSDGAEKTISLFYKDYLRVFLMLMPREVKLARILDLIQLNESQERSSFQILASATEFEVAVECTYGTSKKWFLTAEGSYAY